MNIEHLDNPVKLELTQDGPMLILPNQLHEW